MPSLAELLKAVGLSPDVTPEMQASNDAFARASQANDPAWKKFGRSIVDASANVAKGFLGEDPAKDESTAGKTANWLTQFGSAGEGLAKPGAAVSIFKNKELREEATKAFLKTARNPGYIPHNISNALEEFAGQYPRIAAHIQPEVSRGIADTYDAAVALPGGKVERPLTMKFSSLGARKAIDSPEYAKGLVRHEGTHVAQALGNSNLRELYEGANDLVGYKNNPFEFSANQAMARGSKSKININDKLTSMYKGILENGGLKHEKDAANKIQDILKKRGVIDKIDSSDSNFYDFMNSPETMDLPDMEVMSKPLDPINYLENRTPMDKSAGAKLYDDFLANLQIPVTKKK